MASPDDDTSSTLWHGRFEVGPDAAMMAFSASLDVDRRLWRDDVDASRAHVGGLYLAGLFTEDELAAVESAFDRITAEFESETFVFQTGDEDIHTALERRLTEIAGPAGAKVHTARSRNDQVVTALRLWCRRELVEVARRITDLQSTLLARAVEAGDAYLPGYTHLQRAQPVLLAHHLLAHGWALGRDVDRILDAVDRLDVSPLGAGALAGTSLPIDPAWTAERLGFARVFTNSLDAVSDRDFVAEGLFCLALVGVHLSRLGEEWVLWTSDEFGFARLDDAFSTGSSMLPQKKNADIAELARGKSGRLIGNLTGLLVTLKGLPLAYNRDLQEDKEPLFDSVDQITSALAALTGMIATARFDIEAMRTAADVEVMSATDVAEFLVRRGTPFREAHAVVGRLVRRSLAGEGALGDLVADELGTDAAGLIGPGRAIGQRTSPGGAGPEPVAVQIDAFRDALDQQRSRLR